MKALSWRLIPFILFITLGLFFLKGLTLDPQKLPSVKVGHALPVMTLPSLEGDRPFSSTELKGHVVLLNIWASWCKTCDEEQAFLSTLAKQGVVIYGLNYKDNPIHAKRWLKKWGNPYVLIGLDEQGKAAIDLGVYGAPETFLIDAQGVIRYRYAGALNATVWQDVFMPMLHELS